jgi:hypothetical protein
MGQFTTVREPVHSLNSLEMLGDLGGRCSFTHSYGILGGAVPVITVLVAPYAICQLSGVITTYTDFQKNTHC